MRKAFVLLSGGMDSTTCLHKAILDFAPSQMSIFNPANLTSCNWVEAVSINYGQRHIKEAEYAFATCGKFGINHSVINIEGIVSGKGVMLADADVKIPNVSYAEIKGVSPTYVPYRNGNLLSIIAAHAQKWVNSEVDRLAMGYRGTKQAATEAMRDSAGIYFGAHSEDAANWAYPDCTPEFIGAQANAIYIGSYQAIRLYTPLQWLNKAEIVELGEKLGVDWGGTWSCYAGGEKHCGVCPTCRARKGAFATAGVNDPTAYDIP